MEMAWMGMEKEWYREDTLHVLSCQWKTDPAKAVMIILISIDWICITIISVHQVANELTVLRLGSSGSFLFTILRILRRVSLVCS